MPLNSWAQLQVVALVVSNDESYKVLCELILYLDASHYRRSMDSWKLLTNALVYNTLQ